MRVLSLSLLSLCLVSCRSQAASIEPNTLDAAAKSAGWELLFDGHSTKGWRGFKQTEFPSGWAVADGTIQWVSSAGDLITDEQFENFELELEWKISEGGNSGIFFHVSEDHNYTWETGPEMQSLDNAGHADGRAMLTSAGANYALHAPPADVTRPVGEFNKARILVNGPHVEYWLNGEKQCSYELWSPEWEALVAGSKFSKMPDYGLRRSGHIALQDHGNPVWFRNIRIRRLP